MTAAITEKPLRRHSGVTVSVVSHRQSSLCAPLLDDLARFASASVEKIVLTINIPEQFKLPESLPFPVELVFNSKPKGFGENHNEAFRRCEGAYFAVLNPDVRLERDPFPDLVEKLADPKVGIVAPVILESDGTVADSARRLVSPWEVVRRQFTVGRRADPSQWKDHPPDWLAGIFLVFRTTNYLRLQGFDPRYFLYCEDVDICARARLQGLRLEYVQGVLAMHIAQRASHRSPIRLYMHVVSLLRLWSSTVYREYREQLRHRGSMNYQQH